MNTIYDIEYEKTICFTGHRPNKLFGYDYRIDGNKKMLIKLKKVIERLIEKKGFDTFITGMALGVDMWSAQIILQLKKKYPHIKLVCAIPCKNHSIKWNKEDQEIHAYIMSQADLVYYVSDEPYTAWCMVTRDKWMVDNSIFVVAVWNGVEDGGTYQTIKYSKKRQRKIVYLHPETLEVKI